MSICFDWRFITARKLVVCLLLMIAAALTARQADAASCTLTVPGISFGSYDVFNNQHLDSTGYITVDCDVATPYTISLGQGNGSYTLRTMVSGGHTLNYNLYVDASRTIVWGDGTGSTATVSSSSNENHSVYGRIPARQNAYVGTYADSITVTLNF
jgi:spore coat protein U-like protein